MIENEARTRQAIRGIKQMFREDGLLLMAAAGDAMKPLQRRPARASAPSAAARGTCCAATRRRSRAAPAGRSASRGSPTRTLDRARDGDARRRRRQPDQRRRRSSLAHPDIDIVVELIGGIEPARTLVLEAIAQRQARRHRQQGAARAARQRDLRGRAREGRDGRVRGRGGRRHPDHQGAARGPDRQPHRVDRRHHQRHVATSSCPRCAPTGASLRRRCWPRRRSAATPRPIRRSTSRASTPRTSSRSCRRSPSACRCSSTRPTPKASPS